MEPSPPPSSYSKLQDLNTWAQSCLWLPVQEGSTLLSWIRSSISEEVFTNVVGLKTSSEVFTTPDDPSRSHPVSSSSQDT